MKPAAALLFLAWCLPAVGEVEAPFGRFARPGVPVPVYSSDQGSVTVDGGWTAWLVSGGITTVFVPRVPCRIRDAEGAELLALEAVPDDVFLVGVVGTVPDTAQKLIGEAAGRRVLLQPIERDRLPDDWRAYDLFDLVIVAAAPARLKAGADKALVEWAHAGGRVAALGRAGAYYVGAGGGLGWFALDDSVGGLMRAVSEAPWERAHPTRPTAVRPDLYGAFGLLQAQIYAGPLQSARLTMWGSALASALLLVLGLRFHFSRWSLVLGLLVISLGGGLMGRLSHKEYQPWASGEIHVAVEGGGYERLRVYRMRTAVAGEPSLAVGERETPLLSDAAEAPWWSDPDRRMLLRKGRWRFTLEETIRRQNGTEPVPAVVPFRSPWPGERQPFQGVGWISWLVGERGRPSNGFPDPILRIRAVRQD